MAQDTNMFTCIQEGDGGIPFYYFHGDILGGGFYALRLAKLLGPKRPIYISAPVELQEHELPQVEELAARKRAALQQIQPHGPYILGGFCLGGVVAYEVARQLEAAGADVRHVLLVEPEIGDIFSRLHLRLINGFSARGRKPREKVQSFIHGLQKVDRLREVWSAPFREKTRFVLSKGMKLFSADAGEGAHEQGSFRQDRAPEGREWLVSVYHWVLTSYVPKSYGGRVTVFSTSQLIEQAPYILHQLGKAAPRTRVERIAGEHLTCITHHLETIGRKLKRELEQATAVATLAAMELSAELPFL